MKGQNQYMNADFEAMTQNMSVGILFFFRQDYRIISSALCPGSGNGEALFQVKAVC
jgi:hypothetical protein